MGIPTNQSWSIDFNIVVVQILARIPVVILKRNFKLGDMESIGMGMKSIMFGPSHSQIAI